MMQLISINPATGEELGRVETSGAAEVRNKVAALRDRLPAPPLKKRIAQVRAAAERLRTEADDWSELMTREQGKPRKESLAEVVNSAERLEYFCDTAQTALQPTEEQLPQCRIVTRLQPLGVIGAIKPWNFPLNIPIWTIGPALLAGNAVLFKPSERTPLLGQRIFELFPSALIDIAQGADETGRALVDSDVEMISFVGSQSVGQAIMKASASKLRRLTLELGGKDPMIVCADADLDAAISGAIAGTFRNCGQVCCGVERIYVESDIYEPFLEGVLTRVRKMKVGNGLDEGVDMGPMNREEQVRTVERHVEDARSKGATIHAGGQRKEGLFYLPTVLTDLHSDMILTREETFGPVMPIVRVNHLDEAVRHANATEFGLTATVWSKDVEKADLIAQRLEAGTVGINQAVGSIAQAPWGGVKKSGIGRMLGPEAVREFTNQVNYRLPQ